jgi:DNA-directed RNA polymerase subunit RPC12/RpoP
MSILELAKYRKVKETPQRRPYEYFCARCNAGFFRLLENGEVRCGSCDIKMRDIQVVACPPAT